MAYINVEIQTAEDGTAAALTTVHQDRNAAESAYHSVLAAAALSDLPCHAAVIIQSDGTLIEAGGYNRANVQEDVQEDDV